MSENKLAVELSRLKGFGKVEIKLEQYQSPSGIAAKVLWWAYMHGDIENRVIADFGCGNGILGIGSLLLNAKKVYFVERDKEVIKIARENYKNLGLEKGVFCNRDVKEFNKKVDVVVENPPFGVQDKHADKRFLEKSLEVSEIVYSFHKVESGRFINVFCEDNGFEAKRIFVFDFPLKKTLKFHKKNLYKVRVGVWRIEKKI